MKMNFNKLIEKNERAESKRLGRIESEVEELKTRARSFVNRIDKGMLVAVSKFGDFTFHFKTDPYPKKAFLWDDGKNNMMVISSNDLDEKHGVCVVPKWFCILGGAYGIRATSSGVIDFVKVGCLPEDQFTVSSTIISPDVWTENKCDQRKFSVSMPGFIGIDAIKYKNGRGASYPDDDKRNWFERAEDGLPKFSASFAEYLEERAKGIK